MTLDASALARPRLPFHPFRTPDAASLGLLEGVRVVEYGSMVTAPFASKLLADLGAEVIKVEDMGGDESRRQGPFPGDEPDPEKSGLFIYLNSNKRSVTLNLDTPSGRDLLHALVREADIFIENAPPGVMERRGLTHESLSAGNPRLIVTCIRPFGLSGPYRDYLGNDLVTWHAAALGHRYLGEPDREPLRTGGLYGSYYNGVNAAAATMLAYHSRKETGEGQLVEISEADCLSVTVMGYGLVALFYERGQHLSRQGGSQRGGVPAAMMRCKDGYVFIFASEAHMWEGLVHAMGDPEWAQAEIFKGHYRDRVRYGPEIYAMMQEWLDRTDREEIFISCQRNRVPSTAVYTMDQSLNSVHLRGRGYFQRLEQPGIGVIEAPGSPYLLGHKGIGSPRPAPALGEHNEDVLCGRVGVSRQELTELRRSGVV